MSFLDILDPLRLRERAPRLLDPFGLFGGDDSAGEAEQVAEPAANQLLDRHSRELLTISRDQFGQIRDQHRTNLKQMGNQRTGELQAKAAARQNSTAATKAYGPGVSSTRGMGIGSAMNSVAEQQKNRTAAGNLSLVSDAARQSGQGIGNLSALSSMQQQNEYNRANRSVNNAQGIGQLVGTGIGMMGIG